MPTAHAPTPSPVPVCRDCILDPARQPSDSGWLTTRDAAQALGITVRGVRKAVERGHLRAVKPRWLGMWLVSAEDVARAVEAKGVCHD